MFGEAADADMADVPLQELIMPFSARGADRVGRKTLAYRRRHLRRRPLEWVVKYTPVYYGWVAAALAVLAAVTVSPVQAYCVGVVLDGMMADLQLDRP